MRSYQKEITPENKKNYCYNRRFQGKLWKFFNFINVEENEKRNLEV